MATEKALHFFDKEKIPVQLYEDRHEWEVTSLAYQNSHIIVILGPLLYGSALDKREYLVILMDNFFSSAKKHKL